jgi:transposase
MTSSLFVSVGVDYHEDSIRVCIINEEGVELANRDVENHWGAAADLIQQYGYPRSVAIEACCGAADFAEELRTNLEWDVKLAHPGYVKRLKQSPDKSDYSDAQILADLVRVDYLPEVWLAPTNIRQLRRLVRYRQQLRRHKTETKQQILALLREERIRRPQANRWTKDYFQWLRTVDELGEHSRWVMDRLLSQLEQVNSAIQEAERRLEESVADDPVVVRLRQEKGVGLIVAATLRAEIGRFDRFHSGKQLARFCGVTPCNASSGKRQADAGMVKAGNRELRATLLQTAHLLARWSPRWKQLKEQLARRKPTNVAIVAVANRWIRWLYHQMKTIEDDSGVPIALPAAS